MQEAEGLNGMQGHLTAEQQRAAMNSVFQEKYAKAVLHRNSDPNVPFSASGAPQTQQMLALQQSIAEGSGAHHFDFLPGGLPARSAFTNVSPWKKSDVLPDVTTEQHGKIKAWVEKDDWHEGLHSHERKVTKQAIHDQTAQLSKQYDWFGNAPGPNAGTAWAHAAPGGAFQIRTPHQRRAEMAAGKRKSRVEVVPPAKRLKLDESASFVEEEEWLIPIRLDHEHETQKIRDVFTWNMRDLHIKPDAFIRTLCEDLLLPQIPFHKELLAQINAQLEDAKRVAFRENVFPSHTVEDLDLQMDEEEQFWEQWRKRIRAGDCLAPIVGDAEPKPDIGEPVAHEELRIVIKLDITFDNINLVDQFDWDIADPHNSPEQFAQAFVADLGMPGDFATAIAHSIREQCEVYQKSLGLIEHRPGNAVSHDELRYTFLPPVVDAFRSEAIISEYTPQLQGLSAEELERNEREREREARRKRRQTRGRQIVTLPDREPLKTHRTLMPAPGTVAQQGFVDANDHWVVPALSTAKPFPIIKRYATLPKPHAILPPDSPPNRLKPSRDALLRGRGRGRGLGRPGKLIVGHPERASSQTPSHAPGTPSGSSEWQPKAESPGMTPPSDIALADTTAVPHQKRPRPRGNKKKSRYQSPSAEELASQRDNYIEGRWHCANCGGPEGIVTGRRQGPRGKDTLCGECGKFYHRNRRSRPCVYNISPEHHLALKATEESARRAAVAETARHEVSVKLQNPTSDSEDSEDEPLQRVKRPAYAGHHSGRSGAAVEGDSTGFNPYNNEDAPMRVSTPSNATSRMPPAMPPGAQHVAAVRQLPPAWMISALQDLRSSWPDDRLDIMPRPSKSDSDASTAIEWRIRCSDCPGKVYKPGPDETLDNFLVHLKNRAHRHNVDKRLGRPGSEP